MLQGATKFNKIRDAVKVLSYKARCLCLNHQDGPDFQVSVEENFGYYYGMVDQGTIELP